jgi:hypothetical protein
MAFLMGTPAAGPILWKLVIQHPKKFKGAKFPANWLQRHLSAVWPGWGVDLGGVLQHGFRPRRLSRRKYLPQFILNDPPQNGNQPTRSSKGAG